MEGERPQFEPAGDIRRAYEVRRAGLSRHPLSSSLSLSPLSRALAVAIGQHGVHENRARANGARARSTTREIILAVMTVRNGCSYCEASAGTPIITGGAKLPTTKR